jgi:exonuclease SbcC
MIKRIRLNNFQSHENSELVFSPGVNVIIGQSDSGKTAIIRALRWLVWNRPLGDAYISHWANQCAVEIEIDGHVVKRTKERKSNNRYYLDDKLFNAVGGDIPDEIMKLLNLHEINLQQQLDRPFLLDSSPGEVAQHFNKIAHLDVIDTSIKKVIQWTRKIQQDLTNKEFEIERLENELHEFDSLPLLEERVNALEAKQTEVETSRFQVNRLNEIIEKLDTLEYEMASCAKIVIVEKKIDNILSNITNKNKIEEDILALKKIITKVCEVEKQINDLVELISVESKVDNLLELFVKQNKTREMKKNLVSLINNIASINASIQTQQQLLLEKEKLFSKEMPNICPLCGQRIKPNQIKL